MCGLYRMLAWVVGDYHVFPGSILRAEAALFLVLALAFIWLRPPPKPRVQAPAGAGV
jgi:hypothetical protein